MYASSYYEEIENWNLINKFDRVYIINFDVFVINCHVEGLNRNPYQELSFSKLMHKCEDLLY